MSALQSKINEESKFPSPAARAWTGLFLLGFDIFPVVLFYTAVAGMFNGKSFGWQAALFASCVMGVQGWLGTKGLSFSKLITARQVLSVKTAKPPNAVLMLIRPIVSMLWMYSAGFYFVITYGLKLSFASMRKDLRQGNTVGSHVVAHIKYDAETQAINNQTMQSAAGFFSDKTKVFWYDGLLGTDVISLSYTNMFVILTSTKSNTIVGKVPAEEKRAA